MTFSNEEHRFGEAHCASARDYQRARLYQETDDAVYLGRDRNRGLFFPGQGGITTIGGARSGKFATVSAFTFLGRGYKQSIVALDPKGEGYTTSQIQWQNNKHTVAWNPSRLHNAPQDRINPVSHINMDSLTAETDMAMTTMTALPMITPNARFFEGSAQWYANQIGLRVAERDGVLTMPAWYDAVMRFVEGGEAWLDFAYGMYTSRFEQVYRMEQVMAEARQGEGSGFRGIVAELGQAFRPLSDPILMRSLSPPFTFSFEELTTSPDRYNVHLMPPAEYMDMWAMPMRLMFTCGMIYKMRAPSAPAQLWNLDEVARLKAGAQLLDMWYSACAGYGIRTWSIWQSLSQMEAQGKGLSERLLASSSERQFIGVRDANTAELVSSLCGDQTLEYDDELQQAQAAQRKRAAALAMLSGEDFLKSAITYKAEAGQAVHRSKMKRRLRTQSEVLNTPPNFQYLWSDRVQKLIYCERQPYYDLYEMSGRFLPNPYHDERPGYVRIKNKRWGHSWRRVLQMDPPQQYWHLRQYETEPLTYIEGFPP